MSKKWFLLGLIVCILTNQIIAGEIAYIYNSKAKIDSNVVGIFNSMNLSIDFINSNSLPMDFSSYRFVFIGDEYLSKEVPVWNYRTIVFNHYYGEKFGFTDSTGISSMTSTSVPKVTFLDKNLQVYTSSKDPSGNFIKYYFLSNLHKSKFAIEYAGTYSTSSGSFGEVVSFFYNGSVLNKRNISNNICFFGITQSNYWTEDARELFKDCVKFVDTLPIVNSSDEIENNFTITCYSDSDCGEDGFDGESFCSLNDVLKNFKSYSCINPGSFKSYCYNNIFDKFVQKCDNFCVSGICQNYTCTGNIQCDDANPATVDLCINPSSISASCINVNYPIVCRTNADCEDNNDSTDDSCINPGNINSVCIHNVYPISCKKDIDCDDKNNNSEDICFNPGKIISSCIHNIYNIRCSKDLDCNDNNFLTTDVCINPNEKNSSCSYFSYEDNSYIRIASLTAIPMENKVILNFSVDSNKNISGYYFSKDNVEWQFLGFPASSYIFENLEYNTSYIIYMRVIDNLNISSSLMNVSVTTFPLSLNSSSNSSSNSSFDNSSNNSSNSSSDNFPNNFSNSSSGSENNVDSGTSGGSGSGGGSSGGGGGSGSVGSSSLGRSSSGGICVTKWSCTEWSSCREGKQVRTCYYPPEFCSPKESKPIETRDCTMPVKTNENLNSTLDDSIKQGGLITGGVIEAIKSPLTWVVIFLILIVGIYLYIKFRS